MLSSIQSPAPVQAKRLLRVAVVTETYAPEINGVAHTMRHMVETLLQQGHTVELTRPRQAGDQVPESGKNTHSKSVRSEPAKPLESRLCVRLIRGLPIPRYRELQMGLVWPVTLVAAWRKVRPDVVHIVTEGPLGWSALIAARRLGIPVSSGFHTNFHAYSRHYGIGLFAGLVDRILRALHNRCAATMVPTAQICQTLQMRGYQRLAVVGRGIDTVLFNPSRRSQALRDSWGTGVQSADAQDADAQKAGSESDGPVIMCVGRLAPEKNLQLFIRAAYAMRTVNPHTRVVLVGDGPDAHALRAAHPNFIFVGTRVGADLAAHYASADVFLFPSTTETFGNVTIEALASGLAVIAFDYAAAHQHIVHAKSGVLVPFDDAEAFVEAARSLAETPAQMARLGHHARTAAESLSWGRIVDRLAEVLTNVADVANMADVADIVNAADAINITEGRPIDGVAGCHPRLQ